ncbi:MAG: SCO family protein [Pseudomonadota bacterium]
MIILLVAFSAGLYVGLKPAITDENTRSDADLRTAQALEAGTLLTPSRALQPISLHSATDAELTLGDLQNRWTLVFFGFTNCPNICQPTMQLLSRVQARIAAKDESRVPDILLVTVDPQHDDADTLLRYTQVFGDQITGATGDIDAIRAFASDLGVLFQRVELGEDQYTVDHSGTVLLLDPDARLRAIFSPPLGAVGIANDIMTLTEGAGA